MESVKTGGFMQLDFTRHLPSPKGKIIAEYVWIDGSQTVRSKSRTLENKITSVDQIPDWNYDGSSCHQATTTNSEIVIKPVAFYPDPFRQGDHILVLCESFAWQDTSFEELVPSNTNFRHFAKQVWDSVENEKPWYGIEQEYILLGKKSKFHI